jgi:hypothetical protein
VTLPHTWNATDAASTAQSYPSTPPYKRGLGWYLLEQGVFDHFLRQQVRQLERGHRQQLDSLLQRGRQNELLRQLGLESLRNTHAGTS